MQKWEYCVIGPIILGVFTEEYRTEMRASAPAGAGEEAVPSGCPIVGPYGSRVIAEDPETLITGRLDEGVNDMVKDLVWLGDAGWEMVGCGTTTFADLRHLMGHFLYFKRPKQEV